MRTGVNSETNQILNGEAREGAPSDAKSAAVMNSRAQGQTRLYMEQETLRLSTHQSGRPGSKIATLNVRSSMPQNLQHIPDLMNKYNIKTLILTEIGKWQDTITDGVEVYSKRSCGTGIGVATKEMRSSSHGPSRRA